MMPIRERILLASIGPPNHFPWYALGGGTLLLSLTLIYFMLSRRGETKSVTKCVMLSVWAHVILLGCAYLTSWFPTPVGLAQGTGDVHVQWIGEVTDGDDDPASVDPDPVTNDASAKLEDPGDPAPIDPDPPPPEPLEADSEPDADTDTPALADSGADTDTPPGPREGNNEQIRESVAMRAESAERESEVRAADAGLREPPSFDPDAEFIFASTDRPPVPEPSDAKTPTVVPNRVPHALEPTTVVQPSAMPVRYQGRTPDNRRKLAEAKGGSLDTEAAVNLALQWLAATQDPHDGRWDNVAWEGGRETRELGGVSDGLRADTAVTGLALLAFLSAGHTHQEGAYRQNVRRGLEFLMRSQSRKNGSLAGDATRYAAMYCHGIATLAMSEAYIMTHDPQVREPLQRAINYTLSTQHPVTGGWRYQRGDLGDTSQFGWQLMALVSADSAGLAIPDSTWRGAQRWINRVAMGTAGGLACYTPDRPVASPSMTAEALFCRTFLPGAPRKMTVEEAADYVAAYGESAAAANDLYFSYYATLALFPLQDRRWQTWNRTLTRRLLTSQQTQGALKGSWNPDTRWGPTGGRVYTTSMACLCLEIYYRYLPVYELAAVRGGAIRRY